MTSQRPSRPSKSPPARRTQPPKKRETVEVDIAWLQTEDEEPSKKSASRKGPPPIPGALKQIPPMPVHPSLMIKAVTKPIPREEEEEEPPPPRKSTRPSRAPRKR